MKSYLLQQYKEMILEEQEAEKDVVVKPMKIKVLDNLRFKTGKKSS